jgi:hypothetical protein
MALTPEQDQWTKDAGHWSYHLANKPTWVSEDNESWARSIYDDPNVADPNEKIQSYLSQQRASGGKVVEDDYTVVSQWGQPAQQLAQSGQQSQSVTQQWGQQAQSPAAVQNNSRNTDLLNRLSTRAMQGTAIDRNDPNIAQQVDPFRAEQERGRRDFLAGQAERLGPNANLLGEERMASEPAAQATGSFQSMLVGRELQARRQEIAEAFGIDGRTT